jgi:DNA (cytosine-5)-methyltransferase 1
VTNGWNPQNWNLKRDLPLEKKGLETNQHLALSQSEVTWVDAWDNFVGELRSRKIEIPGFPMWSDYWASRSSIQVEADTPGWKRAFIEKNIAFFEANQSLLSKWMKKWDVPSFPPSRRKFEWQAQDSKTLWECIMHFRPSGIRAKKATYVPALVAITQTYIYHHICYHRL